MMEPPSRASQWRMGFDNPKDYNDNQGFCGGKDVSLIDYSNIFHIHVEQVLEILLL